jgi:NADH-quinone oxidoreductase subunit L
VRLDNRTLLALILLVPLGGALILGLAGRRFGPRLAGFIGCATVGLSALLSFYLFFGRLLALPEDSRVIHESFFTWISVGSFRADVSVLLDPLSGLYILFITFVGFWIHVFATGYMRGDDGYWRFFAYTNLFMFAMLTLVLADNFLLMFVGWEGVGLCSYLLIGYYYTKDYAASAAKKAFVVNRIGDFGFALGVMLLFWKAGSIFYFDDPARGIHGAFNWAVTMSQDKLEISALFAGGITTIAVLLFVGATGKSAQIPLFVWLPDAMAGPTPVSALIHAATMVTAGVYMVSRSSAIFMRAPAAMLIVAVIGAVTALFAATIGIAQWDIKKVLAYSTISQLGYMFLACGVGAFTAGIFHVFTHAFFKALLFLGAGSIIVALHHEQDMRRMGGLKKYMPVTFWTMTAGWLAISGVPFLSGFFSKDGILFSAYTTGLFPDPWRLILWFVGAVTALITAIYMTRLMVVTFLGRERFRDGSPDSGDEQGAAHSTVSDGGHHTVEPRESPVSMAVPLIILAIGAVFAGYLNVPAALSGGKIPSYIDRLLEPSIATGNSRIVIDHFVSAPAIEETTSGISEVMLTVVSSAIAILGIVFGLIWFRRQPLWRPPKLLEEKYKIDEAYDAVIVRPINALSVSVLWKWIDVGVIDGVVNGTGTLTATIGRVIRNVQSGLAREYVAVVVLGAIAIIGYFIWN